MKKLILVLLSTLIIISCTTPSWINNPYESYSRDNYVAAVGYGDTSDAADVNAKAELASLFGLRVSTMTVRTVTQSLTDYDESFMMSNASYADVDNLYGVEIVKRIVDRDGRYVSLCVMEKTSTIEYLKGNILDKRDAVNRLYSLVDETLGTLECLENASNLVTAVRD